MTQVLALPDIYASLEYQSWLRDCFAVHKKNSRAFSYRFVAQKVGMDHSLVVKVLRGQRHLTRKQGQAFAELFGLGKAETLYFLALIEYARAEKDADIQKCFAALSALRPPAQRDLGLAQQSYFQNWWHAALRSLLDYHVLKAGQDAGSLGALLQPPISEQQARDSIETLLQLGLITPDSKGRLRPSEAHISTGERWFSAAIQTYQKDVIRLSESALDRIGRAHRDISTLTVSLDVASLDAIREVLRECRQSILGIIDKVPAEKCNAVYQLNMQLVPLTVQPYKPAMVKTTKSLTRVKK